MGLEISTRMPTQIPAEVGIGQKFLRLFLHVLSLKFPQDSPSKNKSRFLFCGFFQEFTQEFHQKYFYSYSFANFSKRFIQIFIQIFRKHSFRNTSTIFCRNFFRKSSKSFIKGLLRETMLKIFKFWVRFLQIFLLQFLQTPNHHVHAYKNDDGITMIYFE